MRNLQNTTELALRKRAELSDNDWRILYAITKSKTIPLENQLLALTDTIERAEAAYLAQLQEHARDSLSCYVEYMTPDEPPADHHELMVEYLEAIERRDLMRATFSLPPGSAKTKYCSRYFTSWYLGRNPRHRYLQGGHSQSFVEKEIGAHVKDNILDAKHTAVFPECTIANPRTSPGSFRLGNGRGAFVCKGAGQRIAGYRGHIGGGDDLIGSRAEAESKLTKDDLWNWLWADFRTRLLPNSPLFLVATRWVPDDPIGRIEKMNKEGRGIPWLIVNMPAIIETPKEMMLDPMGRSIGEVLWPDYYTVEHVLELKATLPQRDWWALYKGKPRISEGNVVKGAWFRRYKFLPEDVKAADGAIKEKRLRRITLSVDCAQKKSERNNPTAFTVWYEDMQRRHYIAYAQKQRLEYPELKARIDELADIWKANVVLIEDKGHGTTYIQERHGRTPSGASVVAFSPDRHGSKDFRFDSVTPMFESGEVLFPEDEPEWWDEYKEELLSFPDGEDDYVDSTSQYLLKSKLVKGYGSQKLKGANHK